LRELLLRNDSTRFLFEPALSTHAEAASFSSSALLFSESFPTLLSAFEACSVIAPIRGCLQDLSVGNISPAIDPASMRSVM
jgi:hypothetical protein